MLPNLCVLILGGGGFVGGHLHTALVARFGTRVRIINTTRTPTNPDTLALDLSKTEDVRDLVVRERPTHVINLVGIASPVEAQRNPELAWELHALAPYKIGQMLRETLPNTWFFHVSSGLIYGRAALDVDLVDETIRLDPMDIYSMTKAAGDMAVGVLAGEGLNCIRLRPFNHTGPKQTESFAVPAFAAQLARIKVGAQEPIIEVGNLSAIRDFLDVRDVVNAYVALIEQSADLTTGTIYNIASGVGCRMQDILESLIKISNVAVTVELDHARQRPSDLPRILGDATALKRDTGWIAGFALQRTLTDVLDGFYATVGI
ncbi:MAG: GDP-mannose 4,6-dehydratase [Sulfitobacter sp.]